MSLATLAYVCLIVAMLVVVGLAWAARQKVTYDPKKPKGKPRDVPPPLEFRRRKR